jgi:hypothetical protein
MPILNQSSNIPGMMVEFTDGGLALRRDLSNRSTRSVLILGTAEDGPIMTPVAVDVDTAEAVFGKGIKANGKSNGATLPEAFSQLYKEGCRDIRMMRVSGSVASKELYCESLNSTSVEIKSESLGLVGGNDEMQFTLNHGLIIGDSVEVYAGGKLVEESRYSVQEGLTSSVVTLQADSVSVGLDLMIKYKFHTAIPEDFDGPVTVDVDNVTINLDYLPISGIDGIAELDVRKAGIGSVDFTIVGQTVTLDEAIDPLTDTITAVFKYFPIEDAPSPAVTQNSNSVGDPVWVSESAAPQEFDLSEQPEDGQFKLYVDGQIVFNTESYEVDEVAKKLYINKEYFQIGDAVLFNYNFLDGEEITPFVKIESLFGGEVYNDVTVEVKHILVGGTIADKEIVITKPLNKRSHKNEAPLSYKASDYATLLELVEAINDDENNNIVLAEVDEDFEDITTMKLEQLAESDLEGGDNGINISKQEMFEKLSGKRDAAGMVIEEGAYSVLQNYIVDFVVPLGVYADDQLLGEYENFASELAYFCGIVSSVHMHLTHGIISVKPVKRNDMISIENYIKGLEAYSNVYLMRDVHGNIETNDEGEPFDMGQYISVLAGQEFSCISNRLGIVNQVATIKYAAMCSVLKPSSAPTNKKFESVVGLKQKYSVGQLNRLAAKRFVTFKGRASDNAIVTTDGITAALDTSDYRRIVHVNVLRDILSEIHKVAEPFIGEPISVPTSNALTSAIDKKLSIKSNVQTGTIAAYEFRIVHDESAILLGDTRIELSIVPFSERRQITVVVGLKPTL